MRTEMKTLGIQISTKSTFNCLDRLVNHTGSGTIGFGDRLSTQTRLRRQRRMPLLLADLRTCRAPPIQSRLTDELRVGRKRSELQPTQQGRLAQREQSPRWHIQMKRGRVAHTACRW